MDWKPVHSLNDKYEVNADGEIRNAKTGRILHQYINQFGYRVLTVRPEPNKQKNIRMHRVVAEAFQGECPAGMVVNHKDGNKQNNLPSNLEYVTSGNNNTHALKSGLRKPGIMKGKAAHGENHYKAKINYEQADVVRKLRAETGWGARKIAEATGISRGIVSGILYRDNWK